MSQASPSNKLEVRTALTFHSRMKRDGPTSGAYSNHEITSIEIFERDGKQRWSIAWKTIGIPGGGLNIEGAEGAGVD